MVTKVPNGTPTHGSLSLSLPHDMVVENNYFCDANVAGSHLHDFVTLPLPSGARKQGECDKNTSKNNMKPFGLQDHHAFLKRDRVAATLAQAGAPGN